jgi:hypothetical protein
MGAPNLDQLCFRQFPHYFDGGAHGQGPGGDYLFGWNQGSGRDHRFLSDDSIIKDYRTHPNNGPVMDVTAMEHRIMANSYPVSDNHQHPWIPMEGGIVLDIAVLANNNLGRITAKYRIIPDTAAGANSYPANYMGARGDKNVWRNLWEILLKRMKH